MSTDRTRDSRRESGLPAAARRAGSVTTARGRAQTSSSAVTASPRNRPRGVSVSVSLARRPRRPPTARPPSTIRSSAAASIDLLEPGERQRLVEAEPEHHALLRLRPRVELLELARRRRRPRPSAPM